MTLCQLVTDRTLQMQNYNMVVGTLHNEETISMIA